MCAPTRAEFLTGRYYARTGVRGVSTGQERLNADEVTIADVFKRAGYATGAFGKWHNGSQHPYHPNSRGFDEYYGFTSGHWGHYFDPVLEHNGVITRGKGYIIDDLTTHAIRFIEQHKDRPFLCYLPYNTPHSPMQVPEEYWKRHADKELAMHHRDPEKEDPPHLRAALAMCENIDWNVGRVLTRLEELGLAGNTIVIYFSDNGPNGWRWNGGMKGKKGTTDEGGVRVPFLIRWPGTVKAGTKIPHIAGAIDLLPTLTDLAGVSLTAGKPLDGRSLKPLLTGAKTDWPDRYIISYKGNKRAPQVSVRNQHYRFGADQKLYDLRTDPGQAKPVADSPESRAVIRPMKKAAQKFLRETRALAGPDARPFPIGGGKITHLPARDGVAHGGVTRSARAPNCSYFENWTKLEDRISWNVEVLATGEYEVVIHYTCPQASVGATFELSVNGTRLNGEVTEGHDPPLYGMESDRTPNRGNESYVKDWKTMTVGRIILEKGHGELALRALEIPGKEVMDVRLIVLNKK